MARLRCLSATSGSVIDDFLSAGVACSTNTMVETSAISISTETPKNGARQLTSPSRPLISGPWRCRRPERSCTAMIAPEAIAGGADDHGQRGGDEQRVADAPAGAEADDLVDRAAQARGGGERDDERQADDQRLLGAEAEDTQPVMSMATAVTTR